MHLPSSLALLVALALSTVFASPAYAQVVTDAPAVALKGIPFDIEVTAAGEGTQPIEVRDSGGNVVARANAVGGEPVSIQVAVGSADQLPVVVSVGGVQESVAPTLVSGWFSLLPPIIAILIALIFREVVSALAAGIWIGALAYAGFNPLSGTWRMVDTFIVPALADMEGGGHTQIVVFSLLLGGMVGLIAKNGGTMGIVEAVSPFASTKRRGKVATWLAGLAIFFDDYANTLIVGNTMRPITDRLKISREKLAYIVDSTAAPVAAIVPISTWVGYEISLIGDGLRIAAEQQVGDPALAQALASASPFTVFLSSVPYLFYPILALVFVLLTSIMNRDLGPMAAAEKRAAEGRLFREGAQLTTDTSAEVMQPKGGVAHKWWNAALPVLAVIVVVLGGLYTSGRAGTDPGASLMDIFGAADPFATLLWGSTAGVLVAFVLSIGQRILTIQESVDAFMGGLKAMIMAMVILVLAWSLGAVTKELGTAQYLAQLLEGNLPINLLPVVVFITSAAMAFATGTSWTTMAIMIPLVIPLSVTLGGAAGFVGGEYSIMLGAISSVLAGAIFGDHCSPISDTTVLSSTAAGCDHVDHVRTQLPYAFLVALIGMSLGDIGTAYGVPNIVAMLGGVAILILILRLFGTEVQETSSST